MNWPQLIQTDRLILRVPNHSDARAIFDGYAQDVDVVRYLPWRPHKTITDTEEYLAKCQAGWTAGSDLTWALTIRGDDQLIGMIAIRPRGYKHDFGYVLARAHWGRGLMTEAARAIVDLSFTDPEVRRVWAVCDIDNRASARVLEKIGFEQEGVLRRWITHPNVGPEPRDALCYSRVR